MGDKTGISWTDSTWNPIRGCSRVSAGCQNCYAEAVAARFNGPGKPYEGLTKKVGAENRWNGKITFVANLIDQPIRWKRPRRIFVNSMSDLFHENVDERWIDLIFGVMALSPRHTFQILTKRPERMQEYIDNTGWADATVDSLLRVAVVAGLPFNGADHRRGFVWPLPNVQLGVSVENQEAADERIPLLLATKAAKRILSCEPLLGSVDLSAYLPEIDWVIVGGESGPRARPMHPQWARDIRDQCIAANVPFFFKQVGEWAWEVPIFFNRDPELYLHKDGRTTDEEGASADGGTWQGMNRMGKRATGERLDGVLHHEFPA